MHCFQDCYLLSTKCSLHIVSNTSMIFPKRARSRFSQQYLTMLVPIFIQFSFYWHDKHHCQKQLWEDGVISSYSWESSYESKSGKSHKVGTEAETMGQPYLLSFSSWFMQLSILYIQNQLTTKGTIYAEGSAFTHQPFIKKIPHREAYSFLLWVFLLLYDSSLCKFDKYNKQASNNKTLKTHKKDSTGEQCEVLPLKWRR